jgi:hypothetical protein
MITLKLRPRHYQRIEAELRAIANWEKTGKTLDECVNLSMDRLRTEFGTEKYIPGPPEPMRLNMKPCSYCGSRNHLVQLCPIKARDNTEMEMRQKRAARKCNAPLCSSEAVDDANWCPVHLIDILGGKMS